MGNEANLVIRSTSGSSSFKFLHARYDSAFWSVEHLATWLIGKYGLNENSSDFDIVHAAVHFNKTAEFSGGGVFILDSEMLHGELSFTDWQSLWCGDHQKRVAAIANRVLEQLEREPLAFDLVAYDDHVIGRYFDHQYDKHVLFDADPNQGNLMLITDGKDFYASEKELRTDPDLILLKTSISIQNPTKWSLFPTKKRYYRFLKPKVSNYTIESIAASKDGRTLSYKIPQNAELRFSTAFHPHENLINTGLYSRAILNVIETFKTEKPENPNDLRKWLAIKSNRSYDRLRDDMDNGIPIIRYSQGQQEPISVAGYMELTLPAGAVYDSSNLQIPHYLRSVSF